MHVGEMFPSKYIKVGDLKGKEVTLTITGLEKVKYGDGNEGYALSFQGTEQMFGINKTNAQRIAHLHGDDSEGWVGKQITLKPDMTDYQGRPTECVRVKVEYQQSPIVPAPQKVETTPFDDVPPGEDPFGL